MDDLSAVQRLLAEPPPGPDVVEAARVRLERAALDRAPRRTRAAGRGWYAPGLVRGGSMPRRWPGWLVPVAAAAAAAGVILGSLAVSGMIQHRAAGTGPADSGVLARVPRYFVAVSAMPGRAVVGATATGAVLGTVAPPKPYPVFRWVAAAGDGRTFVFAAAPGLDRGPVRYYRLVLGRSGHPGRLGPLPIPPETAFISGLAVSPNGGKLAVSLQPGHGQIGSKIQVFSLATGARREWVWPGHGTIGDIRPGIPPALPGVNSGGISWEANNRTLLFEVTTRTTVQLRLLDTAAPAGNLLASSTRIPIPSTELDRQHLHHMIVGVPLITRDGTRLVAPFFHKAAPPSVDVFTITEFSVRTGKPVQVLYRRRTSGDSSVTGVSWVNTSGTTVIANQGSVFGVQTRTTFTPLPPRTQRLFLRHDGTYYRLPAW